MNLNTANLKVGMAASTDPARMGLNAIHVTADYTEATNGHILARVSLPYQYPCEDIPPAIKTKDAEYVEPFVIPAKAAMAIKLFRAKGNIPCLSDSLYLDVERSNANETARFSAIDRKSTISQDLQKIQGNFPDLDRVLPTFDGKEDKLFHTRLNIAYLETLLAIAKSTGAEFITFDGVPGNNQPVLLKAKNLSTMQKFTGVIMPCRE